MRSSKLVKTIEYIVPTNEDDELQFRLEILEESRPAKRRYYLRLYRLEFVRLRARSGGPRRRRWENADYRCWVVDDNLLNDEEPYSSPRAAEERFRRALEHQIGRPVKRPQYQGLT